MTTPLGVDADADDPGASVIDLFASFLAIISLFCISIVVIVISNSTSPSNNNGENYDSGQAEVEDSVVDELVAMEAGLLESNDNVDSSTCAEPKQSMRKYFSVAHDDIIMKRIIIFISILSMVVQIVVCCNSQQYLWIQISK